MGATKTMSVEDRRAEAGGNPHEASPAGRGDRAREKLAAAKASAKSASEKHISLAVPLRAAERNRRVAASVLAGGLAYRLFLWLLPFGLLVGGAISNAIGDSSRSAHSNSWWLLAVGVPLLLWAGFSGAKGVQLVHSLVWDDPPRKIKPLQASLAFTGVLLAVWAIIAFSWWVRGDWPGVLAPVLTLAPLTGLWLWVSLQLPHRDAPWKALLPGALLVGVGFEVLHALVLNFGVHKLEKSKSLYGGVGATTTLIFFIYLLATLVVTAPVLNSSLYQEQLSRKERR